MRRLIVIFLMVCLVYMPPCYSELEQQEPMYESDTCEGAWKILGLDLRDSQEFRTEHYIFLLNFRNNHTLVISRDDRYMFAGVNIHYAYYIVKVEEELWRMYEVTKRDKDNPVTKLFLKMEKEWKEYIEKGCPAEKKEEFL